MLLRIFTLMPYTLPFSRISFISFCAFDTSDVSCPFGKKKFIVSAKKLLETKGYKLSPPPSQFAVISRFPLGCGSFIPILYPDSYVTPSTRASNGILLSKLFLIKCSVPMLVAVFAEQVVSAIG